MINRTDIKMKNKSERKLTISFLILSLFLIISGFIYYGSLKDEAVNNIYRELKLISDYKNDEIDNWLQKSFADTEIFFNNPVVKEKVEICLTKTGIECESEHFRKMFKDLKEQHFLSSVNISSPEGEIILSYPDDVEVDQHKKLFINQTVTTKSKIFTDIYFCLNDSSVHLATYLPIIKNVNGTDSVIAVVVLETSPEKVIFPLLKNYPAFFETAESFLARKDSSGIHFISDLRFINNRGLDFRKPYTQKDLPAVQAITGGEKFLSGIDYREKEVFAVTTIIEGLNWILVTKIDKEEVYATLIEKGIWISIIIATLLFTAGTVIYSYYRKIREESYKKILEAELNRKAVVSHYESFIKNANDIIIMAEPSGKILEANYKAVETYGYSIEELRNLNLRDLTAKSKEKAPDHEKHNQLSGSGNIYETKHITKSGRTIDVEVSSRVIVIDNLEFIQCIVRNISDRKYAEEKLKQSNILLKSIIDGTKDAIYIKDVEGKYILANKAAAGFLGKDVEEIIGRDDSEFFTEGTDKVILENDSKVLNEGITVKTEEILVSDGVKRIFDAVKFPWRDSNGNIIGLIGISRDYTERIELLNKLKEEKARLSALITTLDEAVFEFDDKGTYLDIWAADENVLVLPKNELIGKSIFDVIPPDLAETFVDLIKKVHMTGQTEHIEYKLEVLDGERWFLGRINPIVSASGEVKSVSFITRDITKRKRAEKALLLSESKYKDLSELLPQSIFEVDISGNLTFANELAFSTFGYSKEDFSKNLSVIQMIAPSDREKAKRNLERVLRGDKSDTHEYSAMRKDGSTFPVMVFSNRILNDGKVIGLRGVIVDITERIQYERALQESETRYRSLIENSPIAIGISRNLKFVYVNPAFAKMYGYNNPEELTNRPLSDAVSQKDLKEFIDRASKREKGLPVENEYEAIGLRKDGSEFYINAAVTRVELSDGPATIGFFTDITQRKYAENALKESEEKYRELFDANPQPMWVYDLQTLKFLAVNESAINHYGYTRDEFLNMTIKEIRPAIDIPRLLESINDYQGIDHAGLWRHLKKDGTQIEVEIISHAIIFNGRKADLVLATDITEKLRAQEEVVKLSRAVEQSPVAIVITNTEGLIEYVNPKYEELTGYKFEEVKDKKTNVLRSGHTTKEEYRKLWETIVSGNEWRGEFHNRKKNGDLFWASTSISPIKNGEDEVKYYLAIKEDVTERKELMNELIRAKEKAERSNELKSEFLAQVSHEIRTPLNAMLSYSRFIQDELEENGITSELIGESVDGIQISGKRIIRTIDLILNVSELQTGLYEYYPKVVSLREEILGPIKNEFALLAEEKRIDFKINIETEHDSVICDEYSVGQIFNNLIDNAIKYTNEGFVKVNLYRDLQDKLVVTVEDSGIGISEDYLSDLFTPFSQEDQGYSRKFDGNGLGMALVKKYCELNEIGIDVESCKGTGTKFRLTFPSDNTFKVNYNFMNSMDRENKF
ncbi:MAG TPA: PAS domain S-box protein [Melioribacteraceae bacterium]|nr:PAS domain S-box protein [Melioribacteraceae bacterium]